MLHSKLRCCDGFTGCLTKTFIFCINAFATPWCLAFHCVRIYFLPCLYFTWESFYYKVWRGICGEDHFHFVDKRFPHNEESLGHVKAKVTNVAWKRLTTEGKVALFKDGIEPSDIAQGALGNCWFLSALACLCEFDGAIQQLFLDKQANPRGKYRIWLYDVQKSKWRRIVVDDAVPTDDQKKPLFSQPHGDEVWVLLLEKALAKFCGSYANIESGHVIFAFEALTGDAVVSYHQSSSSSWERLDMKPKKDPKNKRAVSLFHSGRRFDRDHMFALLCTYDHHAAVLGAGSRGQDDTIEHGRRKSSSGIVPGHAYSIIKAAEHSNVKLLQLRNPWGTFEWTGKWSDGAKEWKDNPTIAQAFHYKQDNNNNDDGSFFISWDDFCDHFDSIDVCVRSQGMSEFNLRVYEDYGLCGPTVGCMLGVGKFLCLCQGLWKMWCGHYGTAAVVHDIEDPFLQKTSNK